MHHSVWMLLGEFMCGWFAILCASRLLQAVTRCTLRAIASQLDKRRQQ